MGVTTVPPGLAPFAVLDDGSPDGARAAGAIGTYLHGAFEDAAVCAEVFGVAVAPAASKAAGHDALARWFTASAEGPEAWLLS
jgi:cobyric acid synthase